MRWLDLGIAAVIALIAIGAAIVFAPLVAVVVVVLAIVAAPFAMRR